MARIAKSTDSGANRSDDGFQEEDGLEVEEPTAIKRPFDPQRIKVQSATFPLGLLVTRVIRGEISTPEFQRKAGIWNTQRKSRLIESLLLRIPIPVFYFAADEDDKWSVVDGVQRTTTICDFVGGQFALRGLEYLTKYEGQRYAELPRAMQRRIEETPLVANVIQPGIPEDVTFNIFSRINTGGMELKGQEVRHALHKGPVLAFVEGSSGEQRFPSRDRQLHQPSTHGRPRVRAPFHRVPRPKVAQVWL